MYADGNEAPRSMQESYASAVSEGRSRVQEHRTTSADLIAAAGMNQHRMGMALMRLVSEWNSGAVPRQGEVPDLKALAQRMADERFEREVGNSPKMSPERRAAFQAANVVEKADMEMARAELRRLEAQATDWQIEEHKLRFQRLKTLPSIRVGLLHWVAAKGWDDGERLVSSVLRYFLSPKCPSCGGSGVRDFAGNNRRGAGKPCRACEGNTVRGELNVPGHGRGKALLQYLRQCTGQAASDLRTTTHRERRSTGELADRTMRKHHARIAELQRADAEAKADAEADTAAVAEKFRNSMGQRR